MKHAALILVALLAASCTTTRPGDDPPYQRASIVLGQRGYGIAGTDQETLVGAEYVFAEAGSEFGGEAGILYSDHTHEGVTLGNLGIFDLTLTGLEVYGGARWTPQLGLGGLQPYASAGATALKVWASGPMAEDEGLGFGWYGRVGVALPIGESAVVDLSYRRTFGVDVDFDGVGASADLDAGQILLSVGISF